MNDLCECVLVVEDEGLIADLWCMCLEDMGLNVCGTAASAAKAIELAEQHRPKVVLMDMRLKGESDGVDAAVAIHGSVGSNVVFITGSREPETIARIRMDHAAAILFKPVSDQMFQTAVRDAMLN
jgi:two-component system, response regulator PdtaR